MKSLFYSVACLLYVATSFSQQKVAPSYTTTTHTIASTAIGEDRIIDIYLPPAYKNSPDRVFPVVYVLDGQEYFLQGVAYQDMLRFRDKSPAFIVVGIRTNRRKRRRLFYQESSKFTRFLNKELLPYIDKTYRTFKEKERVFFGWEMAAGLGFEISQTHPSLFSAYVLASPSHLRRRMRRLQEASLHGTTPFLLVTAGVEETWIQKDSLLTTAVNKRKKWRFTVYNREDHYTTPFKSMHEGLSDYFGDYKPIRRQNLDAYDAYGGVVALRKYYKHRGERYGLPIDIHRETQHFLIYNAMAEDRILRFEQYISEFKNYIPSITRAFWIHRYAKFYAKHHKNNKAIALFELGLERFPKSTLLLEAVGDYYQGLEKKNQATRYYKKALDIDPNLSSVLAKMKNQ